MKGSVRRENFPCFTLFCEIFTNGIVDIKRKLSFANIEYPELTEKDRNFWKTEKVLLEIVVA